MSTENYTEFFKDKTVTLMGLGLLGRGSGDAAFLAQHCKKVYVTDTKTAEELRPSVDALANYKNIEFFLGGHDEKIFAQTDFVIKGAGVRLDNPYIAIAQKNNVPVYMSTALFARFAGIPIIGITGTRGKTTVTSMIGAILMHAGKKVLMGGNLRGISTLSLLPTAPQYDVAVLELDSWQMQGFDALKISPHIGVFTSFYPDHMNYYDGDMKLYLRDKASIYRHQKIDDFFVTTEEVAKILHEPHFSRRMLAKALPTNFGLKVPGAHNLANAGLAKEAAISCGIEEKVIDEALRAFDAVEGRLQFIGKWQDRSIYNDNNATTQEATLAALSAFPAASVVLLCGGADKGLPIDDLVAYIAQNKIRTVLFKGTGSDRVIAQLPGLPVASTMAEAFKKAIDLSKPQDNIVLSPGFASFGIFKNEYDRNDQFMDEVRKLTGGAN